MHDNDLSMSLLCIKWDKILLKLNQVLLLEGENFKLDEFSANIKENTEEKNFDLL